MWFTHFEDTIYQGWPGLVPSARVLIPAAGKGRSSAGNPFNSYRVHKQEANFINFNELLDEVLP